ncbi:hypothetical protein A1O3_03236 [Capronia epimyces CBS 606.96]|uniref:DUF1446 domain-containing protein n=1 Tax=Capronia epimyces CBS 606.96 TaxID=1182542 RepID=W9YBC8_9EURO|nr:uncharacterized protein A1O3_03236 [Capronia epimyces CBS 606.96]EXJ90167.1 hypothetical protein A1O3_03236 [Capronia epimyces CBS 606.96]
MLWQAQNGPVDAITGDYLAEVNLAENAEKYAAGTHPGWVETALGGIKLSLDVINEKKIKVVLDGGALNPKGLALEVQKMIREKGYDLKVAYVYGDDLLPRVNEILDPQKGLLAHLDHENDSVKLAKDTDNFLGDPTKPIVSANAYLGSRAIALGLSQGADIILCGRVSDASPVIGLARWWHGWSETDFDELAGSLIAGHLIECSAYATGANFSGFEAYPNEELINIGLPVVEVLHNGECVLTKHDALNGFVTEDTARSQLLYEIQGSVYLNSDVKADLTDVSIKQVGKDRVHVSGIKGRPPPSTTKLGVFYQGGYQCEFTQSATGTRASIRKKFELVELQIRDRLTKQGKLDDFDVLLFQHIGVPEENPSSQLAGTAQIRVFAQAQQQATLYLLLRALMWHGMQHFSGAHGSMDFRTALPRPYLGYYPAILEQSLLDEGVFVLSKDATADNLQGVNHSAGHNSVTEPVGRRANYEPTNPVPLASFSETQTLPLGTIVQGRSGDKGANVNLGLFVQTDEEWDWLRSLLTSDQLKKLIGLDWKDEYAIERVELPKIKAVHFVVYGPLHRGISSSPLLDGLGKGFADYIRAKYVDVPVKFLKK